MISATQADPFASSTAPQTALLPSRAPESCCVKPRTRDFAPSAQQAETMRTADLLITNGYDFEEGMLDVIESVEDDGVYAAGDAVEPIGFDENGHDSEEDAEHDDSEPRGEQADGGQGDDDEDHGDDDHEGADPHWFTDVGRMAIAVEGIAEHLAEVDGLDAEAIAANARNYRAELEALDAEITETLSGVADEDRVLITNHEVFGYFADAYDFKVAGTVIPSGTTLAEPSAADLAELGQIIEDEGVGAIFADTSSPNRLAEVLADGAGVEVEVVELFSESLGADGSGGETYLDMMQTNAERIGDALGS